MVFRGPFCARALNHKGDGVRGGDPSEDLVCRSLALVYPTRRGASGFPLKTQGKERAVGFFFFFF